MVIGWLQQEQEDGAPEGTSAWARVEAAQRQKRSTCLLVPQPAHAVENPFDHIFRRAFEVGVFNTKDENPAGMTGKEPIEQGRARSAHMQIAGRRRRKSYANRFFQ